MQSLVVLSFPTRRVHVRSSKMTVLPNQLGSSQASCYKIWQWHFIYLFLLSSRPFFLDLGEYYHLFFTLYSLQSLFCWSLSLSFKVRRSLNPWPSFLGNLIGYHGFKYQLHSHDNNRIIPEMLALCPILSILQIPINPYKITRSFHPKRKRGG